MSDLVNSSNRRENLGELFGINVNQLGQAEQVKSLFNQGIESQFDLKKCKEAIAAYDEAIQLDPLFWEAWLLRGIALCQLGRFDRAINCFAYVADIHPNATATKSALNGQAFAMTQLRRYKEALAIYNKARQISLYDEGNFAKSSALMTQVLCH